MISLRALLFAAAGVFAINTQAQDAAPPPSDPVAVEILTAADRIRFPNEAFEVEIDINSKRSDGTVELRKYQVMSKGNDKTVVIVTEPAAERGQTMLMAGRDLWVFLPSVSQPVRLSLAQRLTGQVANGDLARANFAGDYAPTILRVDNIDGEDYHVLELKALDRGVTYQRVLYWVSKKNKYPYKAEFYSVSGRLLKSCRYEKFVKMAGSMRPTRLTMTDALRQGEQSTLEYSDMVLKDLPDKLFTKDYLKKLD